MKKILAVAMVAITITIFVGAAVKEAQQVPTGLRVVEQVPTGLSVSSPTVK